MRIRNPRQHPREKTETSMNYWSERNKTLRLRRQKPGASWARACMCLNTALITDESNPHATLRLWEKMINATVKWVFDCSPRGSRGGNRCGDNSLNGPVHKTLPCGGFSVPFTTKCFFVQFQWSCNGVISRGIGSEDPVGQDVFEKPDARMIRFSLDECLVWGREVSDLLLR